LRQVGDLRKLGRLIARDGQRLRKANRCGEIVLFEPGRVRGASRRLCRHLRARETDRLADIITFAVGGHAGGGAHD
jgi:hypothetical protein